MGETYLESIKVYSSKILTVTPWTCGIIMQFDCNLIEEEEEREEFYHHNICECNVILREEICVLRF